MKERPEKLDTKEISQQHNKRHSNASLVLLFALHTLMISGSTALTLLFSIIIDHCEKPPLDRIQFFLLTRQWHPTHTRSDDGARRRPI
jgi:ABC-type phosphate transport system permease subunit